MGKDKEMNHKLNNAIRKIYARLKEHHDCCAYCGKYGLKAEYESFRIHRAIKYCWTATLIMEHMVTPPTLEKMLQVAEDKHES